MGRKALTKEEINKRIAPRGIVMMSNYVHCLTKAEFACECGHKWQTTPAHISRGGKCPECIKAAKTLSVETVNKRIAPYNISMMGDYKNNNTKTTFRCDLGHEWDAKPSHVMNGNGCPKCAGVALLSADEINDRLSSRGIKMVGKYTNGSTKTLFRCDDGHEWEALPYNVNNKGSGCPHCAGVAHDVVYLWEVVELPNHYKIGITSSRKKNSTRIKEVARKAKVTAKIIRVVKTEPGKARKIELELLKVGQKPKSKNALCGDGATEVRVLTKSELRFALNIMDAA